MTVQEIRRMLASMTLREDGEEAARTIYAVIKAREYDCPMLYNHARRPEHRHPRR